MIAAYLVLIGCGAAIVLVAAWMRRPEPSWYDDEESKR
jgi:hypothetical protein